MIAEKTLCNSIHSKITEPLSVCACVGEGTSGVMCHHGDVICMEPSISSVVVFYHKLQLHKAKHV